MCNLQTKQSFGQKHASSKMLTFRSRMNTMAYLVILCPKISSIYILLNYSIFVNTSGFKRCSFRSMKKSTDFSFDTPPPSRFPFWLISFQYTAKKFDVFVGFCTATDPVYYNVEKLCEVFRMPSEWRNDANIFYYNSP